MAHLYCGAGDLTIDYHKKTIVRDNLTLHEGDSISIDGTTGEVFEGAIPTMPSEVMQVLGGTLATGNCLLTACDDVLEVRKSLGCELTGFGILELGTDLVDDCDIIRILESVDHDESMRI